MTAFDLADDAYDRFMGRYSVRLAPAFADFARIEPGMRVLDVGAGTGALADELVRRLGPAGVAAAEPSPRFVAGLRARLEGVDVREAPAEALPWPDESFDAAFAQLVISFVGDPPAAAAELARVVRPGGVVAVCMWDEEGLELAAPLRAARLAAAPPGAPPPPLRYRTAEELQALLAGAGLRHVETATLEVESEYAGFDEFWSAAVAMAGPDTAWIGLLDDDGHVLAREAAHARLGSPDGPFTLRARAAAARATRA